ncbi:Oxygen regulatory protein NreC [Thermoflexales bacterium]|nr:Oxygen regulatory protein NreC [Thermoflexales bacterium]
MAVRILIADDHSVIRAGLRTILSAQPDLEIVGEAGDGNEALRLAHELRPDVVLTDISMPGPVGGGIAVARRLKETLPTVRVLILTVHEDESLLREAIQAGAAGYIVKRAAETELVSAIQAACRGDLYVHPAMTRALLKDLTTPPASKPLPLESLTPREIDVLRLLAKGYTNRQIADVLHLSMRTVEGHRSNLMSKLDLHSRVELTSFAEEYGLLA